MPDFEKFRSDKVEECREKPFKLKIKKIKQPAMADIPSYFEIPARIRSKKEIQKYPGAGHEGGGRKHENEKVIWLGKILSKSK